MKQTHLHTLVLVAALVCGSAAQAGPVEPERAAMAARSFWLHTLHLKADVQLADRSAEWQFDGIYLFVNPQGGFVMVAADDAVRPILGYSTDGAIEPRQLPIQLQEWLEVYQQQIDWVRENDGQPYAADREAWTLLDNGQELKGSKSEGVGPLLTTQWDQTSPYNLLCPTGTVTGCAATAQAQFMKYWNHPAVGYGNHSYNHNQYGTQSADFGHTFYDWGHMPDRVNGASTYAEKMAVATLMYHCGVSLEMGYGTATQGGSAAAGLSGMEGVASIDNSLKEYFGYSRDMEVRYKNMPIMGPTYTNDEWRALLIEELNQLHPLVYTGAAAQGGHGFICDGYDSREYMHFNFGWSGTGDGYFPVDSISPGVGGAGGNVTYTFNMNNAALFGAVPVHELRVSDSVFYMGQDGGSDSLILCTNAMVNTICSVASNAQWLSVDNDGIVGDGWIKFTASAFDTEGIEREALLTFSQGDETVVVRVKQVNLNEEELCPLTVVMETTRGDGWQGGANLALQTSNGYIFGTASMAEGTMDSVVINVAPHDVYAVWNSGGGTDRYINYKILNQYGETLVDVQSAYYDSGTHFIEWPCAHLGIDVEDDETWRMWPNPASDMLHIDGLPQNCRVEIYDITGRKVMEPRGNTVNIQNLANGSYVLRITTESGVGTEKLIKQ